MSETFKKSWRGWVKSSDGYAVRLLGRTRLEYEDERGQLLIHAEAMSSPWNRIVVNPLSIPDLPERPRSEIVSRIERAFQFRGWNLDADDSGPQ